MNIDSLHYLDLVSSIALALPQVQSYTSYGTPAFHVKKKMIARFKEDGETLVVRCEERNTWMDKQPDIFYITEHYRNYPYVLIKLNKIKTSDLKKILEDAWKEVAPVKLLKANNKN